jgi:hypothetical protein
LTDPDRLVRKEATMAKPWLCRIGRHRWQRLRNPKAAGTANAAAAASNATAWAGRAPAAAPRFRWVRHSSGRAGEPTAASFVVGPFLVPGRAVWPALGPRERWTPRHAQAGVQGRLAPRRISGAKAGSCRFRAMGMSSLEKTKPPSAQNPKGPGDTCRNRLGNGDSFSIRQ